MNNSLVDPAMMAYVEEYIGRSKTDQTEGDTDTVLDIETIVQQREIYEHVAETFRMSRPKSVEVRDYQLDHIPLRIYSIGFPTRTILFCHGGGFVLGGLESHDDICAELCAQTGFRVVAVDYRLAPEDKHPAQFQDAWQAARWVSETYPGGMVLVGDSAGAALCACVTHHARGTLPEILGQVLIYPVLGDDRGQESYRVHANAPLLTVDDMKYYNSVRSPSGVSVDDATYLALYDTNYQNLPPTVLFSADVDPLRDDCMLYRDQLLKAGVKAHWVNERGLVHGYLRARHVTPLAGQSFERIVLAIDMLGQEQWAWDDDEALDPNRTL